MYIRSEVKTMSETQLMLAFHRISCEMVKDEMSGKGVKQKTQRALGYIISELVGRYDLNENELIDGIWQ
ncbi:hypothetical protein BCPG3_101 [Bacillus phage BCPG3]|uniref:Uncharacterized protein n=8 Tax=Wphvirus TaxID=1922327 RepID=W5QUU6_9CAUD|nr:hypothetical protein BPS13_0101 [Bacillus phage BPS13]YP_009002986.1 hypothetical protein BPS10C_100 [Bacillus phage BPS10C]YP_009036330.1 hypothetical protein FP75_gp259 [Bacillus phage Megatron]YP_009036711.1 hypothetical protein FP72_gp262 [Bacillus phage Hakuna]YP_009212206.1 hypothetical protein QLX47_gp266 [Bacillus phage Eyuki]YP_009278278.1 hypothetical protein BI007_gp114 [Bacillus phage DIGNKC]YP_009281069.1 hypothetical protein SAGEFAYGE_266 [Bacillus phage SageFayge]YP_0092822